MQRIHIDMQGLGFRVEGLGFLETMPKKIVASIFISAPSFPFLSKGKGSPGIDKYRKT